MNTNIFGVAIGALLLALAVRAHADEAPYNATQYQQAMAAGKPVVVYLHADWCPICRAQKPIVDRLSREPKFKAVTIFVADFDTETALERSLKVTQQSTFVVFRQGHEVTRSTGQTAEPEIRATLEQAL
ncbi:thioredoxin [Dyella solisilvae]|uniref:Thioredoxin n=1 Tax=Dyella solisilvae TaxID=1920168 RepID=A0A370K4W7_9GAMM|nr:thioredoxin family protein [Dyella solisilvae]RDI97477.1 thioredoxin [Dyella solisilvae]